MNFIRRIVLTGLAVLVFGATVQPLHAINTQQKPPVTQQEQPSEQQSQKENGHPNVMDSWHKVVTLRWLQMTKGDLLNIAGSMALLVGAYGLYKYSLETPVDTHGNGSDGMGANPLNITPVSMPQPTPQPKPPTTPRSDVAKLQGHTDVAAPQAAQPSVQSKSKLIKTPQQKRPAKKGKQKAVVPQNRYIHLQPHESLQQIGVANQHGNSCGYHALLNAQEIMQQVQNGTMPQQLDTAQARAQLFGDNGQWRQQVKQRRIKEYSKRYLKDTLHACMELTDTQKNPDFWEQIRRFFCGDPLRDLTREEQHALNDIANVCIETFMQNPTVTIQFANLMTLLQFRYPAASAQRQAAWRSMLGPQVLLPQTLQNAFGDNTRMTNAVLRTNPYTDNLDTAELNGLVQQSQLQNIYVIDAPQMLGNQNYQTLYGIQSVQQQLQMPGRQAYAFVLRTSYGHVQNANKLTEEELKEIAASEGTHWIAVVVHKAADGAISYYVADSFYNSNRSDDLDIARLINALRGRQNQVPALSAKTDGSISSASAKIDE